LQRVQKISLTPKESLSNLSKNHFALEPSTKKKKEKLKEKFAASRKKPWTQERARAENC